MSFNRNKMPSVARKLKSEAAQKRNKKKGR